MKLTEFIESTEYLNFLDDLDNHLPEKIDRTSKVYLLISNILGEWLDSASMSVDDLGWLVLHDREGVIEFIVKKQMEYTEPDGGKDNIVNEKPNLSFPISHMIEYYFLLKKPGELPSYLKGIRIPGSKQYAEEITAIFDGIKK